MAGTIDFVAETETFKAAKRATASGLNKAAESVGQSQVVRSAVAKHLGSLTDQANVRVAEKERSEALSRQALDLQRRRLDQHAKEIEEIKSRRASREMSWWEATWEWMNGDQAAADRNEDRQVSAETKRLQSQLFLTKTAWERAQKELKEAREAAEVAEKKELSAMSSGVSLQEAADAGAYMFTSFLDRVRRGESECQAPARLRQIGRAHV